MTNNPESTPIATTAPAKKKRLLFALKLTTAAIAIAALLIAITIIIAVYSIAEPKIECSTDKLLAAPQPAAAMTAQSAKGNHTPQNSTPTTSATLATTTTAAALHYAPFIPDTPDFPRELKARRARLNARFDGVLREIAAYEQTKSALTNAQARQSLARIEKDFDAAWSELMKLMEHRLSGSGGQGEIRNRFEEYLKWHSGAQIATLSAAGDWLGAARASESLWRFTYRDWAWAQDHTRPILASGYYRQQGWQDWKRILYCARRAGGVQGYGLIASHLWQRGQGALVNSLGANTLHLGPLTLTDEPKAMPLAP